MRRYQLLCMKLRVCHMHKINGTDKILFKNQKNTKEGIKEFFLHKFPLLVEILRKIQK